MMFEGEHAIGSQVSREVRVDQEFGCDVNALWILEIGRAGEGELRGSAEAAEEGEHI